MDLTIIPDVVRQQTIHALRETNTAYEAAKVMSDNNISALVITDEAGVLGGIVTESDITRRVVAADRVPHETPLRDVMTTEMDTIYPTDSPYYALRLMLDRRYRHLPVVDGNDVVGMVSIRDLRLSIATTASRRRRHPLLRALGLAPRDDR